MFWKTSAIGLLLIAVMSAFTIPAKPNNNGHSEGSAATDSVAIDTISLGYDPVIYPIQILDCEVIEYFAEQGLEMDSSIYPLLYDEAFDWIGVPYKYGKSGKTGTDCSSFVKSLYTASYGRPLQGTSRSLYDQITPAESKKDLKEGDLVFFKIRGTRISHVGVYLRDGYFIHASTKRGVMVNNLSEKYYKAYYFAGGTLKAS